MYRVLSYNNCVPCQEAREEHLDRGAAADCLQTFLATLEARVHKLGQLWTLREEQLNKNRQLSAEFVQFEKDTREVNCEMKCVGYVLSSMVVNCYN